PDVPTQAVGRSRPILLGQSLEEVDDAFVGGPSVPRCFRSVDTRNRLDGHSPDRHVRRMADLADAGKVPSPPQPGSPDECDMNGHGFTDIGPGSAWITDSARRYAGSGLYQTRKGPI